MHLFCCCGLLLGAGDSDFSCFCLPFLQVVFPMIRYFCCFYCFSYPHIPSLLLFGHCCYCHRYRYSRGCHYLCNHHHSSHDYHVSVMSTTQQKVEPRKDPLEVERWCFKLQALPHTLRDTVRAFAATGESAEIAFALSLAAGACVLCETQCTRIALDLRSCVPWLPLGSGAPCSHFATASFSSKIVRASLCFAVL